MNLSFRLICLISLPFSAFAQTGQPNDSQAIQNTQNKFQHTLESLQDLSRKGLSEKYFDVKNTKGESLRYKTISKTNLDQLWSTLDPVTNKVEGTATDRVYRTYPQIQTDSNDIVVAVIDSGVDITHEDLAGKIWINLPEMMGRPGVDDDGDGYIDDIYGWNFIGGHDAKGRNVNVGATTLEVAREFNRLSKLEQAGTLSTADATYFEKIKKDLDDQRNEKLSIQNRYLQFDAAYKLLRANGLTSDTIEAVTAIQSTDASVIGAKNLVLLLLSKHVDEEYVAMVLDKMKASLDYELNPNYDPYSASSPQAIVRDNPEVLNEIGYGNNDVMGLGPDGKVMDAHGTHVAGIIAAVRGNGLGILGQAKHVKIMPIRAVPNGDERDKDVGNAIRFAVDHGAKIINMSFGKGYSPQKAYVDQAMQYAESKGVLIVHAAGNDSKNTESAHDNFPNCKLTSTGTPDAEIKTWIEVGASSKLKGPELPATFSNFGKTSVDVFAPGVDIVSTVPNNRYASFQGTSMASPETAGVAAMLWSYFPDATAAQIKDAIMSTTTQYPGLNVKLPFEEEGGPIVEFSSLSRTGGVVNALEAYNKLKSH